MIARLASHFALAVVAAGVACPSADSRIQGAKGRRLQLFAPVGPYAAGTVFVEEPSVVMDGPDRVVEEVGFRWSAQQFLETRLRELPWRVESWHDEFGPVETLEVEGPALILSTVVWYQGGASDDRLLLESFFRDQRTGRVVARYTGYGRARVRGAWPGARDDLQEITRVLVDQLAPELEAVAPPHLGGHDSRPYRRRERTHVVHETLPAGEAPRMELHGDPPVQHDAPIARRLRGMDEETRERDASAGARATDRPRERSESPRPDAVARHDPKPPRSPLSPGSDAWTQRAPVAVGEDDEVRTPLVPAATTVYVKQGGRDFHLEARCPRIATGTPRRLSAAMAAEEGLRPCRRCVSLGR